MDTLLLLLLGVYLYLSQKTIKEQSRRINKLESFVEEYLGYDKKVS